MHGVKRQCYKISNYVFIKKKIYQSTLIDVICYEMKSIFIRYTFIWVTMI